MECTAAIQITIAFLAIMLPTVQSECSNDWLYLCDTPQLKVNYGMKPARMPHNSRNCADSGVVGSCTTQLRAEVGQRIRISAGVFFKLGDDAHVCSSRFVRFLSNSSSESRADKKCGSEDVNTELFTSPSNTVLVMYQSDNGTDGATFHISAFGCPLISYPFPSTILEVPSMDYGKSYSVRARCPPNQVMDGLYTEKDVQCLASQVQGEEYFTYSWQATDSDLCQRASCKELSPPQHGKVAYSDGLYGGSLAMFTCDRGYQLKGEPNFDCLVANGEGAKWNGTVPTCEVVDCGPLTIENATVTEETTDTTYSSQISYSCSNELVPKQSAAVCDADGNWAYEPCRETTCTMPQPSPQWKLISVGLPRALHVGVELSYQCIHEDSLATLTCTKSGEWDVPLPPCKKQTSYAPLERITPTPAPSASKASPAALVGGIIAGILVVMVTIIAVCCAMKRCKKRSELTRMSKNNNEETVNLKKFEDTAKETVIRKQPYQNGGNHRRAEPEYATVNKQATPESGGSLSNGRSNSGSDDVALVESELYGSSGREDNSLHSGTDSIPMLGSDFYERVAYKSSDKSGNGLNFYESYLTA